MADNKFVRPVLKWAGGKKNLIEEIKKRVPKDYTTYCEPFFGGGAILFSLQPKKAVINDINEDIMNVYKVIQRDVEKLIEDLSSHKNESEYFYMLRDIDRNSETYNKFTNIQKASRIIYLNKTCYNGLFRVNSQGQFNTPFGKYKNPNIVNEEVLRAVSEYFNNNNIEILNNDFEKLISKINKGSFVYLDPPYDPLSKTSSFTGYNMEGFGKNEQIRLKKFCDRLNKNGVKFLLSNSSTKFIEELYKDYIIETVEVPRNINSVASKRNKIKEVLIRNYET